MQNNNIANLICSPDISIKDALKVLNNNRGQILLVTDRDGKLIGTITDGDVRRALLNNVSLLVPVSEIMHKDPVTLHSSKIGDALECMKVNSVKQIPIVNDSMEVMDFVLWKDVIPSTRTKDNYVAIPAGGKGSRLDPFTRILPKLLIPIGDKPIIETIIERFMRHGYNKFIIALNYKAETIKSYFADHKSNFSIEYVHEDTELGTAGYLSLLKGKTRDSLIVSNCDVITDIDFNDLLLHHKKNDFHVTVVGTLKHVKIPYGVLEMKDGIFEEIIEKPEYDFIINSGIYVIEPDVIDLIPDNPKLDMPELLKRAKKSGLRVGVYPFSGEWIDIGQWEEYKKAVEHFKIRNI